MKTHKHKKLLLVVLLLNLMAGRLPAADAAGALVQPRQPDGKGNIEISGELKQWH